MQRILVIRGGAIGDFILTLPALKLLRDKFPSAHIEILGYKHIVALAENRFYANATRSIDYAPLSRFFARDAELPEDLVEYFSGFDLIVSYLFDPDEVFAANLRRCNAARLILARRNFTSANMLRVNWPCRWQSLDCTWLMRRRFFFRTPRTETPRFASSKAWIRR